MICIMITTVTDIDKILAETLLSGTRLVNALMKANKRFDLMIILGADHGLGSSYYMNLIRYYFVENLLGQKIDSLDVGSVE